MLSCYPSPEPQSKAVPVPAADDAAPRPIGPERLRALREAILNGTYPSADVVSSSLVQLFRQPGPLADEGLPSARKPS